MRFAGLITGFTSALTASAVMVGCSAGTSRHTQESVAHDVAAAVKVNETAADHVQWEISPSHPANVFDQWLEEKQNPEFVCDAMTKLTPEKLTIFEEELRKREHKGLVAPCEKELKTKLDGYWKDNTASLKTVEADFKFQPVVVYRDVSHGYRATGFDLKPKQIAFTFDDGPHATYTDQILKTLAAANVKAVFFEMGRNIRLYPNLTRHVAAGGHSIGSHSITHRCLADDDVCAKANAGGYSLSYNDAINEIMGAHQMIADILGWVDPFFRFPYGESSPDLRQFLADRGVGEFYWSMDSNDWRAQTPEHLIESVKADIQKHGKGIILMHDIQHRTALALPTILRQLYFSGYQPVLIKTTDPQARYHSQMVTIRSKAN